MSTPTFESLGVAPALVKALADAGITSPFPIQALTIPHALEGRDVCGKAKTGSGKTLAFGLPLLQRVEPGAAPRRPRALVMVPTRELALQVHDVLEPLAAAAGIKIVAVYGGAGFDKQVEALTAGVEAVIATPGRLIDLIQRGEVGLGEIVHVTLDEADRMADMGFLPQVEWVLRHVPRGHQTLLFSATLDGVVDSLVKHYQHDPVRHEVESTEPTVELMLHRFLAVHDMDKPKVAAAIARGSERTLMFTRTKRAADRLARDLKLLGLSAAPIHGDLRQTMRERALKMFAEGRLTALVATDVAARGIDVEGIDTVIHYDPPEDHKAYLHRSGRTARAGSKGLAVTLVLWNQQLEIEKLQKRLQLRLPVPEVFSNDPRLADLAAWDPAADA